MLTYSLLRGEIIVDSVSLVREDENFRVYHVDLADKHVEISGYGGDEVYLCEGERTLLCTETDQSRHEGLTGIKFHLGPGWNLDATSCRYTLFVYAWRDVAEYQRMEEVDWPNEA